MAIFGKAPRVFQIGKSSAVNPKLGNLFIIMSFLVNKIN